MTGQKVCIVCMKWGKAYGGEYVNMLYRAVRDHLSLDHDFICITDRTDGLDPGITCHPCFSATGKTALGAWEMAQAADVRPQNRRAI